MADLTFVYVDKCTAADPHVRIRALVNTVPRMEMVDNLSAFTAPRTEDEYETAVRVILYHLVRQWRKANPDGTLPQLRTWLEAQTVEV